MIEEFFAAMDSDTTSGLLSTIKALDHMDETDILHLHNGNWKITLDGSDEFDRHVNRAILARIRKDVQDKLTELGHNAA